MCDICQVDSILRKYMGRETARTMAIERVYGESPITQGYRISFGGYWMGNESAASFEATMPKVEAWVFGFAKMIFATQLEAEETDKGAKGNLGPVEFQMTHDGDKWICQIDGCDFALQSHKINVWLEEIKAALEAAVLTHH